ncbi:MAG: hypothetical protein GX876_11010 [Bacteroidales bacterium]|nr:hypothetical protein [Bacteroidales bacterium]
MNHILDSYWNICYSNDLKSPNVSIQVPKIMAINEYTGSGGDMFHRMFGKFNAVTLAGTRFWSRLEGTLGFPELTDGRFVTVLNPAIWTDDGFIVDGVPPDVEVEQLPLSIIQGEDL